MPDLDLDALTAVAEAALRRGDWYDLGDLWEALNGIADVGDDTEDDARHLWEARPATVLALIAEAREAERLRGEVAALADEWQQNYDRWKGVHDGPRVAIFNVHARKLRALIGGER